MTARDPGLQPERTVLAWIRCAAALTVLAPVCLRHLPGAAGWIVTAAVLLAALVIVAGARGRYRTVCADFGGGQAGAQWAANLLLLGAVLVPALVVAPAVVIGR